jgi:hypothetical protein
MKTGKYEIELLSKNSTVGRIEAYEKVCRYLIQRHLEGCEEFERIGLFEGINGGTGRKRLFNTSSEDGRRE